MSNGESSALKVICGMLSGIVVTGLFLWLTFPKDLASASQITTLATQMQKQIDDNRSQMDKLERHIDSTDSDVNLLKFKEHITTSR